MKSFIKNIRYKETGAISTLVLFTVLMFVVILMGVFLGITAMQKSQLKSDLRIQEIYGDDVNRIDEIYLEQEAKKYPSWNQAKKVNKPELLTGMTPIKFTMPTSTEIGTTITTNESDTDWYEYGTTYDTVNNTTTKRWANAQTKDGSMWVWIPRFAYKIDYTNDADKSEGGTIDVVFLIGDTDKYYKEDGSIATAQRQTSINQTIDTTADYTVHPAFTNESKINYANGGWDKELTGIWVAKFEAGYASGNNTAPVKASSVSYTEPRSYVYKDEAKTTSDSRQVARNWIDGVYSKEDANGTMTYDSKKYSWLNGEVAIKYPTFQGLTYSMNYINQNDSYNISKVLTESGNIYGLSSLDADSHLIKNSEWGAVALLSQSQYGLDGTNIYINNVTLDNSTTSVYAVTGMAGSSENAGTVTTTIDAINNKTASNVYTWKEANGVKASSTGTIYGIYDLSGGLLERTSAYMANLNANLKLFGASLTYNGEILKTVSTKYTTVYPYSEINDNTTIANNSTNINTASTENYKVNTKIYGDGVRETSTAGTGTTSWYGDSSVFPGLYSPFFIRGGRWHGAISAGKICFSRTDGPSHYYHGFRAVLVNK